MTVERPLALFFDLDGTLADTAEDLAAPIHAMRAERGLAPLSDDALRPYASMGARGLIMKGLGVTREDAGFEPLRRDFLQRYEAAMLVRTRLFDGMPEVLDALEPEPSVALAPSALRRLGVAPGEMLRVTTRRGTITLAARADPGMPDELAFIAFAYHEAAANILTNPQLDPAGKIPEFKFSAARIEKVLPADA